MPFASLEEKAPSALATVILSVGGVEFCLTSNINNAVGTANSGTNGKRNNMVSISEMCEDEVLIQLNNFTGTLRVKKHDVDNGGGSSRAGHMPCGVTNNTKQERESATNGGATDVDIDDGVGTYDAQNNNDFIDGAVDEDPANAWVGSHITEQKMQLGRRSASALVPQDGERVTQSRPQYKKFLHPDGRHRRIPPDWYFPNLSTQHMYVYWHCGDAARNISPAKLLDNRDLLPLGVKGKKAHQSLRRLMESIDRAAKAGGALPLINKPMTVDQANRCFVVGKSGIKVLDVTPTGRPRNINKLTWHTASKYMSHKKNK